MTIPDRSPRSAEATEPWLRHTPMIAEPPMRAIEVRSAPYAVLLLRVALGIVFLAHAYAKLVLFTLPGTAQFFAAHGFPGWTAYPVCALELFGGLGLIVGAYPRWIAIALLPVMMGALTVHWPNGWSFTAPDGGWEYVAFLIAMLVAQALVGDGAYALRRSAWTYGEGRSW